jgi:hypothetical protein
MIKCAGMGGATAIDSRIFTAGLLELLRNSHLAEKFLVNLLERILGCGNAAFSPAVSADPNLFGCEYSSRQGAKFGGEREIFLRMIVTLIYSPTFAALASLPEKSRILLAAPSCFAISA